MTAVQAVLFAVLVVIALAAPAGTPREAAFELHRQHKWPQAIAAYDQIVKLEGEDAQILFWRGMALWKSARFDAALRDFRRVIELEPANLDAHRNAGSLLAREKRWDEALTVWNSYIASQPPASDAYFERANAQVNKGDIPAARIDAAKACALGKAQGCKMVERLKGQ